MSLSNYAEFFVWAESKFIEELENISEDQFTEILKGPARSLKDLLGHWIATLEYFSMEQIFSNWQKVADKNKLLNKSELLKHWKNHLQGFTNSIKESALDEVFDLPVSKDKTEKITKLDFILMYTDHSSYHRGQLMTFLKLLGIEGINTDYFTFLYGKLSQK